MLPCYGVLSCSSSFFETPWTVAGKVSVHVGSPNKNTGVGCHWTGDLPNPGIEPRSPTLQANSLPA